MFLDEENLEILKDISEGIFEESYNKSNTFNWEVEKPTIEQPPTGALESQQSLQDLICSIKGKLDIISQNCSNEIDSPQLSYLRSLLTTDLTAISLSLEDYITQLNSGINLQQTINVGNERVTAPQIISIPLN